MVARVQRAILGEERADQRGGEVAADDVRLRALHHRHRRSAAKREVLRDVYRAVPSPHDDSVLSGEGAATREGGRVKCASMEAFRVGEDGDGGPTDGACRKDDVRGVDCHGIPEVAAEKSHGPPACGRVVRRRSFHLGAGPDDEVLGGSIALEPICEFVAGCELGPVGWVRLIQD